MGFKAKRERQLIQSHYCRGGYTGRIQEGRNYFMRINAEGTESNIHVGNITIGYLDEEGALATFDIARLYSPEDHGGKYVWGRHIDFFVPLHVFTIPAKDA